MLDLSFVTFVFLSGRHLHFFCWTEAESRNTKLALGGFFSQPNITDYTTSIVYYRILDYNDFSSPSDEPTCTPAEVNFNLSEAGMAKIRPWMEVVVANALVTHCPALHSCKPYIKLVSEVISTTSIFSSNWNHV